MIRPASRPVAILGTSVAVPGKLLTAHEFDSQANLPAGESERITGIRQRHVTVHETASQLAVAACHAALADAQLTWDDVDCLVCASATMDQSLPYNAAMVYAETGRSAHHITTLDVGASCLSFLQALDLMSFAVAAGRHHTVLIVSSDIASFTVDHRNLRENGIFGDGAAAAILRATPAGRTSGILASRSLTLSEGVHFCQIRSGGSRFHRRGIPEHSEALFEMRGRQLFALVGRHLPRFVDELLEEAGVSKQDLALLIPHQASRQALDHVAAMLGFNDGRMVDVFGEFGNQVGASLPTALHFAIHRYGLQRGQKALILGTGAGVSIGGIVFEY